MSVEFNVSAYRDLLKMVWESDQGSGFGGAISIHAILERTLEQAQDHFERREALPSVARVKWIGDQIDRIMEMQGTEQEKRIQLEAFVASPIIRGIYPHSMGLPEEEGGAGLGATSGFRPGISPLQREWVGQDEGIAVPSLWNQAIAFTDFSKENGELLVAEMWQASVDDVKTKAEILTIGGASTILDIVDELEDVDPSDLLAEITEALKAAAEVGQVLVIGALIIGVAYVAYKWKTA